MVKGRWDTKLELLGETSPTDGTLQVYIMRELQKELGTLIEHFRIQSIVARIFRRIHESNVTKACENLEEAEKSARKLWDQHNTMFKRIQK